MSDALTTFAARLESDVVELLRAESALAGVFISGALHTGEKRYPALTVSCEEDGLAMEVLVGGVYARNLELKIGVYVDASDAPAPDGPGPAKPDRLAALAARAFETPGSAILSARWLVLVADPKPDTRADPATDDWRLVVEKVWSVIALPVAS